MPAQVSDPPQPAAIDYRALLKLYMALVDDMEGTMLVRDWNRPRPRGVHSPQLFTDEQWAELQTIAAELNSADVKR